MNTPIYLALLVAVAPAAKARLAAFVLRDDPQDAAAARPRLDAALTRSSR